jgi:hypothetical protein
VARAAVARGHSVRATEKLVRDSMDAPERAGKPPRSSHAATASKSSAALDLEERLSRALGGPVELDEDEPGSGEGGKKSGTITIRYLDLDHLDRLLDKLL